jgi:hypothetical protein
MNASASRADAAREVITRRSIRRSLIEWGRYKGFEAAPHHRLICEQIEDFLAGDDDVLLLFAPPGSAKSTWLSILFPSYYLARFPGSRQPTRSSSHKGGGGAFAMTSRSIRAYLGWSYRQTVKPQIVGR